MCSIQVYVHQSQTFLPPGFHTEEALESPSPPRKLENLYSLILMYDALLVPHKLLLSCQEILYETLLNRLMGMVQPIFLMQ